MPSITVQPLADAAASLGSKTPIGAALSSAEWADVPLQLRETAFFSARVESARLLSAMQDGLVRQASMLRERVANGEALISRDSWMASIRGLAEKLGVQTVGTTGAGTVRDIRSNPRLGLIYDFQTQRAAEFARWKMEQDPDVLDAYPAQELVRIEDRQVPRDWRQRWAETGTPMPDGRMVALKSSPVWAQLSRFGTPFPPLDFGSGMGYEDIDRDEAERLGLIEPQQRAVPAEAGFADNLEASAMGLDDATQARLLADLGDRAELVDGRIRWRAA